MGTDLRRDDIEMTDETLSDSMRFLMVGHVLQSVRMDPFLVDPRDKDNYEDLLSIVDPTKHVSPDDEPLLMTTFMALSEAISKIDIVYHDALLHNVFAMSIWYLRRDTRDAILGFITKIAVVADQFLKKSLKMLVNNFTPTTIGPSMEQPRWLARKKEIHSQLHQSLKLISETVPLATRMLRDIIDESTPRSFHKKAIMIWFVECMLSLDTGRLGELLGDFLLGKVVDLLRELDVGITWEDILQEDHNKCIFDMDFGCLDEDTDSLGHEGTMALFGENDYVEKLDGLMVVVCEHLKSIQEQGCLLQKFDMLKTIFQRSLLKLHKSKFVQFIMFYACSLDPPICGIQFPLFLTDIFTSTKEDPITSMSAVSYIGSYLSRARFISADIVVTILKNLVDWCVAYCDCQNDREIATRPINHQIFYAGCQAVMYILCFRLRSIIDYPNLKSDLFQMPFGYILTHKLQPLKVCLPSIVNEFLRQAKAARLFNSSSMFEDAVESDLSKDFGGIQRLDMFFPFDPYLLKESDRYVRPNFEFWSMIKTTYSDNSDYDDEFGDLEAPDMNEGSLADDVEIDFNSDDELEYSMNKMSITPHCSFYYPVNNDTSLRMPSKIRPSVSPPS